MTAIMSSHGSNMNLWYTAAPASLGHLWGQSLEGRCPPAPAPLERLLLQHAWRGHAGASEDDSSSP